MKWTFHPTNKDLTTSVPLSVEISEWEGNPKVKVSQIGELELKKSKSGLRADFHLTLPGEYQIEVTDALVKDSLSIKVAQHDYLNFSREFGSFGLLFILVMGGIIIWTKKIMRKKTL